jgi:hypothetical protein
VHADALKQASVRQRTSIASNILDLRNHAGANTSGTPEAEYDKVELELTEDSGVGVLHPPKGWKEVPKVPAIMVRASSKPASSLCKA